MKIAVYFFRVAMLSTLVINISFHSYMSYIVSKVASIFLGIILLGCVVFEIINYRNNKKTPRLRNKKWKYTSFVHITIPAFFLICLFSNLFITERTELLNSILFYALWFSYGLFLGSVLIYYMIRKDMENIRKQIEQREKNAEKSESKSEI